MGRHMRLRLEDLELRVSHFARLCAVGTGTRSDNSPRLLVVHWAEGAAALRRCGLSHDRSPGGERTFGTAGR